MPRPSKGPRLYLDKARGVWVIRDGTRFIRTGCTKDERKQAEIEFTAYLGKKHEPERGPDPLIADVLLFYAKERIPQTKAAGNAAYHIADLARGIGGLRVSDITPATCREYSGKKSASSSRRDLETLRAAIRYWDKENGPLSTVPHIVLPAKPEPRERWLTRNESRRLRKAAMKWPHLYRFIIIGLLTGSRSGAILGLQWSWVDLESRLMRRRAHGEAEDARKRTPEVRISRRLARLLRRWKRKDGRRQKYVIHFNGRPIKSIKKTFALACEAAGIEDASPHTLRHTRATWLMQEGVDMWEAAGHLGMSVEMLTRQYGKHHPSYQEKASEV